MEIKEEKETNQISLQKHYQTLGKLYNDIAKINEEIFEDAKRPESDKERLQTLIDLSNQFLRDFLDFILSHRKNIHALLKANEASCILLDLDGFSSTQMDNIEQLLSQENYTCTYREDLNRLQILGYDEGKSLPPFEFNKIKEKRRLRERMANFHDVPDPLVAVKLKEVKLVEETLVFEVTAGECYNSPVTHVQITYHVKSFGSELESSATGQFPLTKGLVSLPIPGLRRVKDLRASLAAVNSVGIQPVLFEVLYVFPWKANSIHMYGNNSEGQFEEAYTDVEKLKLSEEVEEGVSFFESWGKVDFGLSSITEFSPAQVRSNNTTLCLVDNCQLLQWGLTLTRQNGLVEPVSACKFLHKGILVHSISIGKSFCVASTVEGRVLTWGDNRMGQLGQGFYSDLVEKPTLLDSLKDDFIIDVKSGMFHCVVLSAKGNAYSWGKNQAITGRAVRNRFGDHINFCNEMTSQNIPQNISTEYVSGGETVVQIDCGLYHSAFVTNKGSCYMWGDNQGRFLPDYPEDNSAIPMRIPGLPNCKQIRCGEDHNIALASEGTQTSVYAWGDNASRQCGNTPQKHLPQPKIIEVAGATIESVWAGPVNSYLISDKHEVYAFGAPILGLMEPQQPQPVRIYQPATQIHHQCGTLVVMH
jgi:alpha-tubulin suppressor-like RCC1 family protein